MRQNKYHNVKVIIDGHKFDSKKEAKRWLQLKELERDGTITELQRQVPYELIPHAVIDKKVVERAVMYYADFVYKIGDVTVVEDTKGQKTPEYIIKRKLMLHKYGIRISEV